MLLLRTSTQDIIIVYSVVLPAHCTLAGDVDQPECDTIVAKTAL